MRIPNGDHLHGCLTHFRSARSGNVYKLDVSDVRNYDVYGRLARAEEVVYRPSIILGSKKVQKAQDWPFSFGFLSLETAARSAATIVIAGYSFRDEAVNRRPRESPRQRSAGS